MNKQVVNFAGIFAACICVLSLAGCKDENGARKNLTTRSAGVELVAIAPDGTRLWVLPSDYSPYHDTVYFASSGTQTNVRAGKVVRKQLVPTVMAEIDFENTQ